MLIDALVNTFLLWEKEIEKLAEEKFGAKHMATLGVLKQTSPCLRLPRQTANNLVLFATTFSESRYL